MLALITAAVIMGTGNPGSLSPQSGITTPTKDAVSGLVGTCDDLITKVKPDYAPEGWTIKCVGDPADSVHLDMGQYILGITRSKNKTIEINRGYDAHSTVATIYHEWGHAEHFTMLTGKGRDEYAHLIGKTKFDRSAQDSAVEIWASSRARCEGYEQDRNYPLADCDFLDRALKVSEDDPIRDTVVAAPGQEIAHAIATKWPYTFTVGLPLLGLAVLAFFVRWKDD